MALMNHSWMLLVAPFILLASEEPCCFYGNPSRSYCPCSYALEASLDFLYLQPFEEGLVYAIRNDVRQGAGGADGTPGGPLIDLEPRWQPGVRIALGYAPSFTARVVWTWFHANTADHAQCNLSLPGTGLQSVWVPAIDVSTLYDSAAFRWKLDFDILDVELGKRYEVSPHLSFNPICLFRVAWIDQAFDAHYGASDSASAMNDFRGIGPGFAIRSEWGFAHGWGIFFGSGFALLYGQFATHYGISLPTLPAESLINGVDQNFHRLTANADFSAGVGYGRCLSNGRWRVGGSLNYETHLYWNQNLLSQPLGSDAPALLLQQARDLSIQGFSLRAYFEF